MRSPQETPPSTTSTPLNAESLFRTHPISEIRLIESDTQSQITEKQQQLRTLVGKSYRSLIESADSIILMSSTLHSASSNLLSIKSHLLPTNPPNHPHSTPPPSPSRAHTFFTACRVKYLVDTPENIWGCLDQSMLLEASGRYLRAKTVHQLISSPNTTHLSNFPLLNHQWQIVESFKSQISLKSRDRLLEPDLTLHSYSDALSAAATIDDITPAEVLTLFLDSRKSWIHQKLLSSDNNVIYDVMRIVRATLGQVGELFLVELNEMPMFYKMVLGAPPGTQLFGGIPNPEEEVRLWKSHREKLESVMVTLPTEFIAERCCDWLRSVCGEIFGEVNGKRLVGSIDSGEGLSAAERMVREALDGRDGLEPSLEQWLKSVFGAETNESPWDQIRGLILKDGKDILEDRLEEAFVRRMKEIVGDTFEELKKSINVRESVEAIVGNGGGNDFKAYLKKSSVGGVWFSELNAKRTALGYSFKVMADENEFQNCLNAYFGPEVSRIRDAVDVKFGSILEDLLCFVESHNATLRLKELAPYLQDKCYNTISVILKEFEDELGRLATALENNAVGERDSQPPSVIVERSLFIGRLLFALRNHSGQIPVILGSPRQWVKETSGATFANLPSPLSRQSKGSFDSPVSFSPGRKTFDSPRSPRRQFLDSPRRQTISAALALFAADGSVNPKLEELNKTLQELCIKAHSLWITWVSNELSVILAGDLSNDDALSVSTPLRGWEVTVVKQEESAEGSSEMKISLPSMPSLYIISYLFQACLEIHKVGGHVLDRSILQKFAWRLLEKVIGIYENFLPTVEAPDSRVSEKGVLQILLDLRFAADILSGGKDVVSSTSESNARGESSKNTMLKPPFRRKQSQLQHNSVSAEPIMGLIRRLSQRLDPIDWATYEPYLWENEKQSYKRHAVLFGFLVQLNRMYTDVVQRLPNRSNADSNILRCSTVPRFKYLPISAPALSSRGQHKSSLQTSADDTSSRSPWKAYSNGERSPKPEFDDSPSFGAATPLLKSFMTQVGSKFGESTSRWGSMLSDGMLKDRSASAMSTFGDMLPGPAAGFLSSFTSGTARFDS